MKLLGKFLALVSAALGNDGAVVFVTALAAALLAAAPAAVAADQGDFGMPKGAAEKAKKSCAKLTHSFNLQAVCMQMEKDGYDKLNAPRQYKNEQVSYDPAAEAEKAKPGAAYREPGAVSLCPPPRRMTERDGCR